MVRIRLHFGSVAAAMLIATLAIPGSTTAAPPLSGEAASRQATERLFNAVHANDYSAVQASIGAGADVEARNSWGVTAADLAVDKGYFRIAHYLVSVRNFQRTKGEQAVAAAAATKTGGKAVAASSERPAVTSPQQAGRPTPAVSMPVSAPVPTPSAATTPAVASVPAVDVSGGDNAANPFDPKAPAYGAEGPVTSN